MAAKPSNHVTKAMAERLIVESGERELPLLGTADIAKLKVLYPQRCIRKGEDQQDFLWYSAKAELVSELEVVHDRAFAERQQDANTSAFERMLEDNILAADGMAEWAGR